MSKQTFVVTTQALLNKAYGCVEEMALQHYWKLAGSGTYVVHNCPRDTDAIAGVLLHLARCADYGWLEYPKEAVPFSKWDVSESIGGDKITVLDLADFTPFEE